MKFRTRLQVTFLSFVLLPLLLTCIAFLFISFHILHVQQGINADGFSYEKVTDALPEHGKALEEIADKILTQWREDSTKLEQISYYKKIGEELTNNSIQIIVRKDSAVFYATDDALADKISDRLPEYKNENVGIAESNYLRDVNKYVKQIDFTFSDGSNGSIFMITRMTSIISRKFLPYMFLAIAVILILTSYFMTKFIQKGVLEPVDRLNVAMKNIKDGNFDYVLQMEDTRERQDEISELYRNYEDMRLRLKESTEEKLQNEKTNKELISNITHDLKTPITAIKGYVEGIMDGVADTPEKVDRYIKTIYSKANEMDRLINELTTYSSIDNNRIPYNFHRINVADYFGDCLEEVGLELEAENIRLNYTNMTSPDTVVIADPEQMKKVINNIIGNAVKYNDKTQPMIDIRIIDLDDAIQIEIEDNGRGIAQKDLSKIFERFYRTDASRNSIRGGSGIGLSIVKKIVEDHGGYVWATSKEGEGTCMHFVIRKYKELEV